MTILNNIDELALEVRDANSRSYIEEAIRALRAESYRSAIIATWIAVSYDLTQKIRELSNSGEKNAINMMTSFDNAVSRQDYRTLLNFEQSIIEVAQKEFEMLQDHEAKILERIREDRHLCAHPAFVDAGVLFQPTPDVVHSHIVHAITYVLRQQPMQGKSALTRIYSDIVSSSFPPDLELATKYLGQRYLSRAKESLVRNLLVVLLKKLLKEKASTLDGAFTLALSAVARVRKKEWESVLSANLPVLCNECEDDGRLLNVLTLVNLDERCWEWCGEPMRIKITEIIRGGLLHDSYTPQILTGAMRVPDIATMLVGGFDAFSREQQIRILELSPIDEFIPHGIRFLVEAGSFRSAETILEKIIVPMASRMTSAQIIEVVEATKENGQVNSAKESPRLLLKFFNTTLPHLTATSKAWGAFLRCMRDAMDDDNDYYAYPALAAEYIRNGQVIPAPEVIEPAF